MFKVNYCCAFISAGMKYSFVKFLEMTFEGNVNRKNIAIGNNVM